MAVALIGDRGHLLCGVDPQFGVHRLLKNIRGESADMWREEISTLRYRIPALSMNRYFVLPSGGTSLDGIRPCVENPAAGEIFRAL